MAFLKLQNKDDIQKIPFRVSKVVGHYREHYSQTTKFSKFQFVDGKIKPIFINPDVSKMYKIDEWDTLGREDKAKIYKDFKKKYTITVQLIKESELEIYDKEKKEKLKTNTEFVTIEGISQGQIKSMIVAMGLADAVEDIKYDEEEQYIDKLEGEIFRFKTNGKERLEKRYIFKHGISKFSDETEDDFNKYKKLEFKDYSKKITSDDLQF